MKNRYLNQTMTESAEYLDYQDLSRFLKLSVGTLRNWKCSGRLTYSKIGGKVLFPRREIEKMLISNTIKATQVAFQEFVDCQCLEAKNDKSK